MSIKSIIIAAALGASTLVGVGAASADPYREGPHRERVEHRIERRDQRFENRQGRREHRFEARQGRREARFEHREGRRDGRHER